MGRIRVDVKVNTRGVRRAVERVQRGGEQGVQEAAEFVLDVATPRTPFEEGPLVDSGDTDADGLEASVFFDTVYAARQHEETTWDHAPGETAKYLEEPFNDSAGWVREIIGDAIRRELR
ncbi:hypothetical protein JNW90_10580 [Micromonospora sp. STR1s_5]|nr:hypothetical protein [Micromonospora sp. STR1s_5]